jgi:hypothetical protein
MDESNFIVLCLRSAKDDFKLNPIENISLLLVDAQVVPIFYHGLHVMFHSVLYTQKGDRLCGLVVRVAGYRFRGPYSIPGSTRFSEK